MRGITVAVVIAALAAAAPPPPPRGSAAAVYALLERLYPGASPSFALTLDAACPTAAACFTLAGGAGGAVAIAGTTASELSAGLGAYLRDYLNATVGWPRGGGSRIPPAPAAWPAVRAGTPAQSRAAPFSFVMNVCTHSYTLVWHDENAWEGFIDWAALNGINMLYALTGQEEVQYKVFTALGLDDLTVRAWFNGPAYLTWSRGQNSHGSSIGGPLPRSWMRAQHALQLRILARLRELGIIGLLPAFQGVVPWPLAAALGDANITRARAFVGPVDTGYMDALDPAFARVADLWMATLCADFNCTDHWYQLDGFFHNGTSWGRTSWDTAPEIAAVAAPACAWSAPHADAYLAGCAGGAAPCTAAPSLAAAQAACAADAACGGVTLESGLFQLRAGAAPIAHTGETSWVCARGPPAPDPAWAARGAAAYAGIARTDRAAVWGWQGWALNVLGQSSSARGVQAALRGLVAGVPADRFVVIDMSVHGSPSQWAQFEFGDVPFVWTALETFGGNDALKGNLSNLAAAMPWAAFAANASGLWGLGSSPEGYDQNPPVYEALAEASFRAAPLRDAAAALVARAHRRYGLSGADANVTAAWAALAASSYGIDLGVSDGTGVALLDPALDSTFWASRARPTALLCAIWRAWGALVDAGRAAPASGLDARAEPFVYDLTNAGREVLAHLATPLALDFRDALHAPRVDAAALAAAGAAYADHLRALDALLAADAAFLLGPWIAAARAWGANASDCGARACADFYEWNARAQLTTWYPPPNRTSLIARDGDYARKHWSGLVSGYYAARVDALTALGLRFAGAAVPAAEIDAALAAIAFNFVGATDALPIAPAGDPVALGASARAAVAGAFATCAA